MTEPLPIFYKAISLISFYLFFILPPVIYTCLVFTNSISTKWKVLIVIINTAGSWVLINLGLFMAYQYKMYYADLYDNFSDMPASIQQVVNNGPTGAALAFGLLLGYLYMPVISLILYPVYKVIKIIYRKMKKQAGCKD